MHSGNPDVDVGVTVTEFSITNPAGLLLLSVRVSVWLPDLINAPVPVICALMVEALPLKSSRLRPVTINVSVPFDVPKMRLDPTLTLELSNVKFVRSVVLEAADNVPATHLTELAAAPRVPDDVRLTVPELITVPPVCDLAPERVRVPAPDAMI